MQLYRSAGIKKAIIEGEIGVENARTGLSTATVKRLLLS